MACSARGYRADDALWARDDARGRAHACPCMSSRSTPLRPWRPPPPPDAHRTCSAMLRKCLLVLLSVQNADRSPWKHDSTMACWMGGGSSLKCILAVCTAPHARDGPPRAGGGDRGVANQSTRNPRLTAQLGRSHIVASPCFELRTGCHSKDAGQSLPAHPRREPPRAPAGCPSMRPASPAPGGSLAPSQRPGGAGGGGGCAAAASRRRGGDHQLCCAGAHCAAGECGARPPPAAGGGHPITPPHCMGADPRAPARWARRRTCA